MNASEEFVYRLCRSTFLSLWSYPNPLNKKGKELCDILVVCHPDVILLSVKHIGLDLSKLEEAAVLERWHRKAIEDSVRQLFGAERGLVSLECVIRSDGSKGLNLPPADERRIHRVAIALGSERKVPIYTPHDSRGFVHVFDEDAFEIVLRELDTISDFLEYLLEKERFFSNGSKGGAIIAAEEDLLALYLYQGRRLPSVNGLLTVENDVWAGFAVEPQRQARLLADRPSYLWDGLIEVLSKDYLDNSLDIGFTSMLSEAELIMRTMARESRFERRILGKHLGDFIGADTAARIVPSSSDVVYMFMKSHDVQRREDMQAELIARSLIARGLNPHKTTVIGIAIETSSRHRGYALQSFYLQLPIWDVTDQENMEKLQAETGFFTESNSIEFHEDEYPAP